MDLHFERRGSGEPVLLIQGMSGTHLSWGEPFLTRLEPDFDTVSYDHRGIGFSPKTTEPFTIAELADDAAALLDRLGIETAHVLGISMGGMVAQELALRHGARIRTLTLGCTYCGGPGSALAAPEVAQLLFEGMRSGDRELALRNGFSVNVSAAFAADEANFAPFREMALAAPARVQTIMLQMQAIAAHDTQARLGSIDRPTLVIHGTEDQMLPPVNGELIASLIPGARLELLEGTGHMWWWERPERGAQLVREHALAARPAQ
jgi:pimeloyl-ACP methyl ester carboxylesterase